MARLIEFSTKTAVRKFSAALQAAKSALPGEFRKQFGPGQVGEIWVKRVFDDIIRSQGRGRWSGLSFNYTTRKSELVRRRAKVKIGRGSKGVARFRPPNIGRLTGAMLRATQMRGGFGNFVQIGSTIVRWGIKDSVMPHAARFHRKRPINVTRAEDQRVLERALKPALERRVKLSFVGLS